MRKAIWILTICTVACCPSYAEEPAPLADLVFRCPDASGLCTFDPEQGWGKFFEAPRPVTEYRRSVSGFTIVLSRGHQEEGSVLVLSPRGEPLTVRSLQMAINLEAAFAETKAGVILCNASPGRYFCDGFAGDIAERSSITELVPLDCIFPRAVSVTEVSCLAETDGRVIHRIFKDGRRAADLEYPGRWLPTDVLVIGGHSFVLQTDQLFRWTEGQLEPLNLGGEDRRALWLHRGNQAGYAVTCQDSARGLGVSDCLVARTVDGSEWREIWRSETMMPTAIDFMNSGTIVIDASDDTNRSLYGIEPASGIVTELWHADDF